METNTNLSSKVIVSGKITKEEMGRKAKPQSSKIIRTKNIRDYMKPWDSERELKIRGLSRLLDILCIILSLPMQSKYNDRAFKYIREVHMEFGAVYIGLSLTSISSIDSMLESFCQLVVMSEELWVYLSQYKRDELRGITVNGRQLLEMLTLLPDGADHKSSSLQEELAAQDDTRSAQAVPEEVVDLAVDLALAQIKTCFRFQREHGLVMNVIAVLGERGKKVLKALGTDRDIGHMFDAVIFVTVLGEWTAEDIDKDIACQLGLITGNLVSPGPKLHRILQHSNFLVCVDDVHERKDLLDWVNSTRLIRRLKGSKLVFGNKSDRIFEKAWKVELLKIRMDDHLEPWFSFCRNVGQIVDRSMAANLVRKCCGHLLATIILARSLRGITDTSIWESALQTLSSSMTQGDTSTGNVVMVNVLKFVLERKDYLTRRCLIACAPFKPNRKAVLGKINPVFYHWISNNIIDTEEEGERIVRDLVEALLMRTRWEGREYDFEITEEVGTVILRNAAELNPLLLHGDGLASLKDGRSNATQIHLMNDDVTELPESVNCPNLKKLFLQMNCDLTAIPASFFKLMPNLQEVDLSNTSIKSLPQSFFKLVPLQKLFLRSCEVFMELPPQIGRLHNLEVLDLQGTYITNLPAEIGNLSKLTCLKVSFCESMSGGKEEIMIPESALSKLSQLIELHIDVDPEDRRWEGSVKVLMKELVHLKQLKSLQMYLPEAKLLGEVKANLPSFLHDAMTKFKLIVGSHMRRIMSPSPLGVENRFENWKKCFKYVNGKGNIPSQVMDVLRCTDAFYLDRHFTATKLSEFGIQNMENMRFCILGGCNELQTIVDTLDANLYKGDHIGDDNDEDDDGDLQYIENPVLPKLRFLVIYDMKKLGSIFKGPLCYGSLNCLKSLTLHGCSQLRIVFTLGSLVALTHLEELTVEDCPVLRTLITWKNQSRSSLSDLHTRPFIGKLKRMSLHYLPELRSISSGLYIAPWMEKISVYNCAKLKSLSSNNMGSLKVIRGESEWWNGLEWREGRPRNLSRVFVPIDSDADLGTQLEAMGQDLDQTPDPVFEKQSLHRSRSGASMYLTDLY